MDPRPNGRKDGWTDGRTDRQTEFLVFSLKFQGPSRPFSSSSNLECSIQNIFKFSFISVLIFIFSANFGIHLLDFFSLLVHRPVGQSICLLVRNHYLFLDASTHLYKRLCPSVRRSVGPSVRRSVRPSVDPSVRHAFIKNKGNQHF